MSVISMDSLPLGFIFKSAGGKLIHYLRSLQSPASAFASVPYRHPIQSVKFFNCASIPIDKSQFSLYKPNHFFLFPFWKPSHPHKNKAILTDYSLGMNFMLWLPLSLLE